MNLRFSIIAVSLFIFGCSQSSKTSQKTVDPQETDGVYIKVLGIAQDGGMPHINNPKEFEAVSQGKLIQERVVSLGLIDTDAQKKYLFPHYSLDGNLLHCHLIVLLVLKLHLFLI